MDWRCYFMLKTFRDMNRIIIAQGNNSTVLMTVSTLMQLLVSALYCDHTGLIYA